MFCGWHGSVGESSELVVSIDLISFSNGDGFAHKFGVVSVAFDQQICVQVPHSAEVVVRGGCCCHGW